MKALALFFLVVFSFSNIYASGKLQTGTQVVLIPTTNFNSESQEQPQFVVFQDVVDVNGNVLIANQTPVILESELIKRKGIGKPGEIHLNFISTTSVDGQKIFLKGTKKIVGEDKSKKVLGISLGLGLMLISPMLAFLSKKGGSAEITNATTISNIIVLGEYSIK